MASSIARNVRRACTKVFHHPNPSQVPYDEKIQKYVKHSYFYIFSYIGVRETRTAYFIPGRVGHGAWITWDLRRRRLVVNTHLGPIFRPFPTFFVNFPPQKSIFWKLFILMPTANPKLVSIWCPYRSI